MAIKTRHAVGLLVWVALLLPVLRSFEATAFPAFLKLVAYTLLTSSWVNVWTNAQVALPCSSRTAINGMPFPSLIDATTEDLISGLESGLFTSVDLVNAYVARIMEVSSKTLHPSIKTSPVLLESINTTPPQKRASSKLPLSDE
jgi:hypothetical protein